jgi:hypothetical protein
MNHATTSTACLASPLLLQSVHEHMDMCPASGGSVNCGNVHIRMRKIMTGSDLQVGPGLLVPHQFESVPVALEGKPWPRPRARPQAHQGPQGKEAGRARANLTLGRFGPSTTSQRLPEPAPAINTGNLGTASTTRAVPPGPLSRRPPSCPCTPARTPRHLPGIFTAHHNKPLPLYRAAALRLLDPVAAAPLRTRSIDDPQQPTSRSQTGAPFCRHRRLSPDRPNTPAAFDSSA